MGLTCKGPQSRPYWRKSKTWENFPHINIYVRWDLRKFAVETKIDWGKRMQSRYELACMWTLDLWQRWHHGTQVNKWGWSTEYPPGEEKELFSYLRLNTKSNSRWVIVLNVKGKVKILGEFPFQGRIKQSAVASRLLLRTVRKTIVYRLRGCCSRENQRTLRQQRHVFAWATCQFWTHGSRLSIGALLKQKINKALAESQAGDLERRPGSSHPADTLTHKDSEEQKGSPAESQCWVDSTEVRTHRGKMHKWACQALGQMPWRSLS